MRNQEPIFVSGFSRGGTTILMNLLTSHPDVCTVGETHQVFKGRNVSDSPGQILARCLFYDFPALVLQREDVFSPRLLRPRKRLRVATRTLIDRVLYREKLRSRHPHHNLMRTPSTKYTSTQIAHSRLLAKNLDGAIYLNDTLREMYPEGRFVCLVRHGLALCEGHLRRGRPVSEIAPRYRQLARKMVDDASRFANFRLLRFEDLLANPIDELRQLYCWLNLDCAKVNKVRLQHRKRIDGSGQHRLEGAREWDVEWGPLDELPNRLDAQINARQIARLKPQHADAFLQVAGEVMRELGYDRAATAYSLLPKAA